ncbi:MAG: ABC transporter permease [Melioribacteraceae bacterium]
MPRLMDTIENLQDFTFLTIDIFKNISTVKKNYKDTIREMYVIGSQAFLLAMLGGLFAGVILAIEAGHSLDKFGAVLLVGRTVSYGMIRELGPVVTGLLLAARTSAKNTSEIGAMQLSEQIDALKAFGISPVEKIVVPRVVAALVMFLPLTLVADITGVVFGMLVTKMTFNVDIVYFWTTAIKVLEFKDIFVGTVKPIFFAFFIASVSCYYGLKTKGGTTDLGINSISAVVVTTTLVLLIDFIFTKVVWEIM